MRKTKRVTYVCHQCGSSDVAIDAWAEWDIEKQDWVLRNISTTEFCDNCYSETQLVEVKLKSMARA